MPTPPHARYTPLPTSIHTLVERTPNAILLETSRFDADNHHSYLFLNPTRILTRNHPRRNPRPLRRKSKPPSPKASTSPATSPTNATPISNPPPRAVTPFIRASADGCGKQDPRLRAPLAHLAAYPAPIVFDHATGTFLNPANIPGPSGSRPLKPGSPPPSSSPQPTPSHPRQPTSASPPPTT